MRDLTTNTVARAEVRLNGILNSSPFAPAPIHDADDWTAIRHAASPNEVRIAVNRVLRKAVAFWSPLPRANADDFRLEDCEALVDASEEYIHFKFPA